jgi:5'-nucleotidase
VFKPGAGRGNLPDTRPAHTLPVAVTLVPPPPPETFRRDGRDKDHHPSAIPTVLVTNDDGVAAPGLAALAAAAAGVGHVVVVAPADDRSGAGAAVAPAWLDDGILLSRVDIAGLGRAYAVDGPPALCVIAGLSGGLGVRPRMVVSGVNRGPNTGLGILHSGTVGAALTAGNLGVPALAISIDSTRPRHLDTAATVAAAAMGWLLHAPAGTVLNVNVPDVPIHQVRGVREAPLGRFGAVEATRRTSGDPGDDMLMVRLGPGAGLSDSGSDAALLAAGFVTVTCIVGVRFGGWTGVAAPITEGLRSRSGSPAFGRS